VDPPGVVAISHFVKDYGAGANARNPAA